MDSTTPLRDQVEGLIIRLAKASKMYSFYQSDHKLASEICLQVHQILEQILFTRKQITIGIISNELAFEKKPYIETSAKVVDFIQRLTEKGLKKITFMQGVLQEEIFHFINIISEVLKTRRSFEETQKLFDQHHIIHIKIGHISLEEEELLLSGVDDVRGLATKSFERGVKVIERQLQNLIENKPVDMDSVRLIAAALINCLLVNKSLLMIMTSIKLNNEEDYLHNLIVCVFTMLQAEMLGLDRKYFVDIASATLLHNIGKLYSEKQIDLAELQEKDHTVIDDIIRDGVKILLNTEAITPLAPLAAMEYPIPYNKAKTGNPIYNKGLNLVSMMITIASYYDRLRSSPEYQVNEGLEKIYIKMQSMSDKSFHPDLLGNFFNVIGIFPPGTLVELDNGEVGVVIRTSMVDLYRPTIEIIHDSAGQKYSESRTINLLERDQSGHFPREIRRSLAPDAFEIPETVGS